MNINEFELPKLPKISDKQFAFVVEFYRNKKNRVSAYRIAYNSEGKYSTVWKEATKLLNNPLIIPYIQYYDNYYKEYAEKEIEYSIQDAINEIDMLIDGAIEGDKNGIPNIASALKGVEMKCKIKGYGKDNICLSGDVTMMPDVVINGNKIEIEVGDKPDDKHKSVQTSSDTCGHST